MRPAQDLDLEEDLDFQRREWRFQRIGWLLLCLCVLAAMAGLLGTGPLSRTSAEKDILRIEYHRFSHRDATTPLNVIYRHKAGDTSLVLEFDRKCLADAELERTRPVPKGAMARTGEGLSYEFDLAPGAEWTTLHFLLKPSRAGPLHCKVMAEGLAALEFEQFVFP